MSEEDVAAESMEDKRAREPLSAVRLSSNSEAITGIKATLRMWLDEDRRERDPALRKYLDWSLRATTRLLNGLLLQANEQGLSVTVRTNGYDIQLRQGELAEVDIHLNTCKHPESEWMPCPGEPANEVCNLCRVTRAVGEK